MSSGRSTMTCHATLLRAILMSLVLFLLLGSAALASPPDQFRDASTFAGAISSECVVEPDGTEVCTTMIVEVFVEGNTTDVCVSIFESVFPPAADPTFSDTFGCGPVAPGDFQIDKKLAAASLAPTTVAVTTFACDAVGNCTETPGEVVASADWTGVGSLIRFRDRSTTHDGKCVFMFQGSGSARNADATITVDDVTADAIDAILVNSKTRVKISTECN